MGNISAKTHQFHRGQARDDGNCLFWSALNVFKQPLTEEMNEDLRKSVATCILNYPQRALHDIVMSDERRWWKNVEEYCSLLEKGGEIWGGEAELTVLSKLYEPLICVIFVTKRNGKQNVWSCYYGEQNQLTKKCVYILYEELFHDNKEGHYDPLYLMNIQNSNEKEMMFDPNNDTVNGLLRNFIEEEFEYNGFVKLGVNTYANVNEVPNQNDETGTISNLFVENSSIKRKAPEIDEVVSPPNDNKKEPITIPEQYYNPNKRTKFANAAGDKHLVSYNNKIESIDIDQLLQTDMFKNVIAAPMNQQPSADQTTAVHDGHEEEKINKKQPLKEVDDQIQNNYQVNYNSEPLP